MKIALIGAFVVQASMAIAQDVPFDPAATQDCLAAAETSDAGQACIGLSTNNCTQSPDGGTTVGMTFCLDQERDLWDVLLNKNYQARMAEAKQIDAEMRELGSSVASQENALRSMQQAWIPFRDASCDYERSKWGGGTGGGPATVACLMQLTARQALQLSDPQQ